MKKVMHLFVLAGAAFATASTANAQDNWVGRTIILKRDGVRIGHSDSEGKQVYLATLDFLDYKVLREKDGWLQVNDGRGNNGWFDKADAVLLDDAIAYFTDRIRRNPRDAGAFHRRATAWRLKGEFDIAIKDYGDVLRLAPGAFAFHNRGLAWASKKEYAKAIDDYNEAIRIEPAYAFAYNDRAWLWSTCPDPKFRDGKKAEESANSALKYDPKNISYLDSLAAAHAEAGNFSEALNVQLRVLDDPAFTNDVEMRRRLELYRDKKPYRQP